MKVYFNLDAEDVKLLRREAEMVENESYEFAGSLASMVLRLIPAIEKATKWSPEEILAREG